MSDIITEITINLPKERVVEYASDPENAPYWCKNIRSVAWDNEAQLRAGTKLIVRERLMRRNMENEYEVVEIIPGQKVVVRSLSNGMKIETTVGWQAIDEETTCMTVRVRAVPRAFSKAIVPFKALTIKNTCRRNLKRLKRILEFTYVRMEV